MRFVKNYTGSAFFLKNKGASSGSVVLTFHIDKFVKRHKTLDGRSTTNTGRITPGLPNNLKTVEETSFFITTITIFVILITSCGTKFFMK